MAASTPNGVCSTCSLYLRFCVTCGKPIRNKYYEFDGVGPYCETCRIERPACDVCSAPLTDQRWQLSDGRIACDYCNQTAVHTPPAANVLYEEMKAVVSQHLGLSLNIPTGLALVDRNQLAEIIYQQQVRENEPAPENADSDLSLDLDPQRTLGIYARRGMRRGIYIQTGLPRLLFFQVAAHEYAHAWQGENTPLLRNQLIHEGFAEWVAYSVLGRYGYLRSQERMRSRTDIYGQGLQWALETEARYGAAGVIEACRRAMG
jgi:hypothetical protein